MLDDIKPRDSGDGGSPPKRPEEDYNTAYAAIHSPRLPVADEKGEIPELLPAKTKKLPFKKRLAGFWRRLTKPQRIILIAAIAGLVIGGGLSIYALFIKNDPPPATPVVARAPEPPPEPKPTTLPSPLTGMEVKPELAKLPVTGVMIENSPDARPQAGLRDAGVVFEAIAEGGITRFLALYQEAQPDTIGPVRSVRPYYLDFLVPFDAPVAHVGGSGQALAEIRTQGIKDLDQFYNPGAYQRSSHRYAPHNVYTSRRQLLALHNQKDFKTSQFTGFPRKPEAPLKTPKASVINLNISSFNYNSVFTYDKKTNGYARAMAGKPHVDEKSGKPIAPKVLIAVVADHSYAGIYSVYAVRGKGTAYIFQDGDVVKGTWHKRDRKTQFSFKTGKGEAIKLNAGQTWITLADNPGQVQYKP